MSKYFPKVKKVKKDLLSELFEFLRQPSIAAKNQGMSKMAGMVESKLKSIGAETKVLKVDDSYPYIYGELGEGEKTLLIYDHYDVQPCDNLKLWESDPFEPEIREGKIYARGVSDNKGNFMLRVQAIRLIKEELGNLPIKIKFLVEGEEEIGSPNLHALSDKYGDLWADSDICLWESGGVNEEDVPEMVLGQKGVTYIELSSKLGKRDLHSGNASLVNSALWRLVHALATLRDSEGNVTIPELNKSIKKPTESEKQLIKDKKWEAKKVLEALGRKEFIGGYKDNKDKVKVLTNHYFKPTCNICGIWGGFTEPGGIKTVLPNKASVKIDFRLVQNQDSTKVAEIVREHLSKRGFEDIKVKELLNEPVSRTPIEDPMLQKAIDIISDSYEEEVQLAITSGGSGPGHYVASRFNIPIFHLGAGYPETQAHAPNENVRVKDYLKALDATIDIILNID